MFRVRFLVSIALLVAVVGCSSESVMKESVGCVDTADIQVACDIRNPEDLVYFAPTNEIIFGQYGDMVAGRTGALSALDADTMATRDLDVFYNDDIQWGDPNCTLLPEGELSPHGLDLSKRQDGSWQLLVVNHYLRESIEFFEVIQDAGGVMLHARGCVEMPADNRINDVAATADTSGFIVTHMHEPDESSAGKFNAVKLLLGLDTGYVMEWSPSVGFKRLPGSDGSLPNGITIAPDLKSYYVNEYTGSKVSQINRATGELLASWDVSYPDNSAWGNDGKLYVSSALGFITDALDCPPRDGFNCMLPFVIEVIDPIDGSQEQVYRHEGGLIPVATVAIPLNGYLYLGSYSGDRLSRIRLQ